MNKPYMPSNASEGFIFMALFCEKCYKEPKCKILPRTMAGVQAKQWVYNSDDEPTCTSFARMPAKRQKRRKELFPAYKNSN